MLTLHREMQTGHWGDVSRHLELIEEWRLTRLNGVYRIARNRIGTKRIPTHLPLLAGITLNSARLRKNLFPRATRSSCKVRGCCMKAGPTEARIYAQEAWEGKDRNRSCVDREATLVKISQTRMRTTGSTKPTEVIRVASQEGAIDWAKHRPVIHEEIVIRTTEQLATLPALAYRSAEWLGTHRKETHQCEAEVIQVRDFINRISVNRIETATLGMIVLGKGEAVTTLRTTATGQQTTFTLLDKAAEPLPNGRPTIVARISISDRNQMQATLGLMTVMLAIGSPVTVERATEEGMARTAAEVTIGMTVSRAGVTGAIAKTIMVVIRRQSQKLTGDVILYLLESVPCEALNEDSNGISN